MKNKFQIAARVKAMKAEMRAEKETPDPVEGGITTSQAFSKVVKDGRKETPNRNDEASWKRGRYCGKGKIVSYSDAISTLPRNGRRAKTAEKQKQK